jgi:pimeloyl-ACP methyl ester carboxylesterase
MKFLLFIFIGLFFLCGCHSQYSHMTAKLASDAKQEALTTIEKKSINSHHTFVLVHGATGGGWDWKEVARRLNHDGHLVYRPTLTGLGEKVHLANQDINLTTHINDIVNLILYEDLHDVVLSGHSYGGMVITGVMDRISERISHVIFLDAMVPNDGQSALDIDGPLEPSSRIEKGLIYFSWLDLNKLPPRDEPQPLKTYTEPVSFKNDRAKKIPVTYIAFIPPNMTLEERSQDPSWLHAKSRGWTMQTLASDHVAERTHVNELVVLLEEASQKER